MTRKEMVMDRIARSFAYLLPQRILYWVVIRVWARLSTSPQFSSRTPDQITSFDALKALR